jgi:outer membrane PBP1 activator LpoA protein
MPATQPAFLPRLATLLCAVAMGAFITGCVPSQPGSSGPASADRADRLLRRGDNAAAAEMYEQLAERNPAPQRSDYAFASARAWLAANRADDAQRALELAAPEGMAAQQLERELLRTEVALARGQYAPAWQRISQVPEPREAAQAARLFQLRERVALRSGQPVEAVRAGSARERVAMDEAARTQARRELLADLRSAIEGGLRIDPGSSNDPLVRGWFEVAQIAVAAGRSPLSAQAAITRWRSRFPGHPASTIAESDILRPAERPVEAGSSGAANNAPLAMLLPLTGRYATEAGLIRDGFQAAIARLSTGERPQLRVYDTGTLTVATALQNALAEGAGFIVGPLTPEEVQAAYEQRPANLPMLLLNTLPGGGYVGNQLYQFGLATEDEARQIARQITGSGKRNALVLSPVGDWGTRVAGAFSDELTRDGGTVIAQASYDETKDLTATLTAALGIDAARARKQRVQSVIGATLLFDAHPRPDIEAIFVAGYQNIALRQINPQLRFFNAGDVPIYVTQQGIGTEVAGNRDLEGMWVLDTPWALDTVGPVADLRAATESAWSTRGVRQSRFFALGYDSATVTLALRRGVAAWPLAGLTGRLNLTPEGRIERSLNWGRMKEGLLQPFDPVARQ